VVGGNAVHDGGVIAADDACNLAEAVATVGVVADEPPQLVARSSDGATSAAAAELIAGDAASATDGIDQLEQSTGGQLAKDGIGTGVGGHGVVQLQDGRCQES
jgi:hypothetical protein